MPSDINTIVAWATFATALTSTISYFLIYSTLKVQLGSNRIEQERYLLEKRPLFKLERVNNPAPQEDFPEYLILKRINIRLERSDIFKYHLKISHIHPDSERHLKNFVFIQKIENGIIEGSSLSIDYTIDEEERDEISRSTPQFETITFELIITYENILGNKFEQNILVPYEGAGICYPPRLVKK